MKHVAILLFLFLGGCGALVKSNSSLPMGVSPFALWAAGETVSLLHSEKTMEDHVVSFFTNQDCSLPRVWNGKGAYCMTQEELLKASLPKYGLEKTYCYESIAAPTCYNRPSPFPNDRLIGVYDRPVYAVGDSF